MYLRHKDSLRIREIAESWPEERDGPSTPLNALTLLLQGFWQARLTVLGDEAVLSREWALKALVAITSEAPHPGLMLDSDKNETNSSITPLEDGSVSVDVRKRVVVPEDGADWTETQRAEAYKVLAECRSEDISADFLTGFRSFRVAKRPFLVFIRLYRLRPPTFWFDPDQPGRGLLASPDQPRAPSAPRKRGRPAIYDHSRINQFLENLLLNEGLPAFENKATVYKRLQENLDAESTPSQSHFGTHLNKWIAAHDPPLRTA